jgi:2OG-Fe(II) oxygenase superfamily
MISFKNIHSFTAMIVQRGKSSTSTGRNVIVGMQRRISTPSLDVVASLMVATGIVVVFYDAHQRGVGPLQNQQHGDHYWQDACQNYRSSPIADTTNNTPHTNSRRPSAPAAGATRRHSFSHRLPFNQEQCQQLSSQGYIVIDNFLSPQEVQHALESVRIIEARSSSTTKQHDSHDQPRVARFGPSANQSEEVSMNRDKVRTDQVCFIHEKALNTISKEEENDKDDDDAELGLRVVQQLLGGIAHAVTQSSFAGFQEDNDDDDNTDGNKTSNTYNHRTKWIGVPDSMQVSLYDIQPSNHPTGTLAMAVPGDFSRGTPCSSNKNSNNNTSTTSHNDKTENDSNKNETHSASKAGRITNDNRQGGGGGDYYLPHRDGCHDSWTELGLLGYLRSKYLRTRYLTCIVYLNDTPPHEALSSSFSGDSDTDNNHPNVVGQHEWDLKRDGGSLRLYTPPGPTTTTTTTASPHGILPTSNMDSKTKATAASASASASATLGTMNSPPTLSTPFVDIVPRGGRLVIFSSQHLFHAVLPTFRKRIACTVWLSLNHHPYHPPTPRET